MCKSEKRADERDNPEKWLSLRAQAFEAIIETRGVHSFQFSELESSTLSTEARGHDQDMTKSEEDL